MRIFPIRQDRIVPQLEDYPFSSSVGREEQTLNRKEFLSKYSSANYFLKTFAVKLRMLNKILIGPRRIGLAPALFFR